MTRRYKRHNGGPCPVAPDTLVDVLCSDDVEVLGISAKYVEWLHFGPDHDDVVGWRLNEPSKPRLWWLWLSLVLVGLVALALMLGVKA